MEAPSAPGSGELARRLREAGADELRLLVAHAAQHLAADDAAQLLLNPFTGGEEIALLVKAQPGLLSAYALRRDLAFHPHTPETVATQLVQSLFWRDLARLAADVRVKPVVRRSAEVRILERLPALAVGERTALARMASGGLLNALRHDGSPLVIVALLENPRLTEATLMPLVANEQTSPEILRVVATNPRFGVRHPLRLALVRNTRTPADLALGLLPGLTRAELQGIGSDVRLAGPLRQRARLLAGPGKIGDRL